MHSHCKGTWLNVRRYSIVHFEDEQKKNKVCSRIEAWFFSWKTKRMEFENWTKKIKQKKTNEKREKKQRNQKKRNNSTINFPSEFAIHEIRLEFNECWKFYGQLRHLIKHISTLHHSIRMRDGRVDAGRAERHSSALDPRRLRANF